MAMKESTVALEPLRQAMRLEQEGHRFYLEAAERMADPRGAEMFRSLARDEELHLRTIRRQYEALSEGKGWIAAAEKSEKPIDLDKPLLPPDRETLERTIKAEAGAAEVLHFALEFENNAYNLYRKAAAETTDPTGRAMYEWLSGQELEHFNLLMLNYEYLARSGHWLGLQR